MSRRKGGRIETVGKELAVDEGVHLNDKRVSPPREVIDRLDQNARPFGTRLVLPVVHSSLAKPNKADLGVGVPNLSSFAILGVRCPKRRGLIEILTNRDGKGSMPGNAGHRWIQRALADTVLG